MRITSDGVRAGLITAATIATPVLPLLVHHRVISSDDATQVGVVIAAVIAAFHGGRAVNAAAGSAIDAHIEQALAVAEPDPTMPAATLPTSPAGGTTTTPPPPAGLRIDTAPNNPQ